MNIRIVLVDDDQILRAGLSRLMQDESDLQVVGEGHDGLAAVALARELRPDVIVMNLSLTGLNGVEAARRIRMQDHSVGVLCRSRHCEAHRILAAIDAGAAGCVGRGASYVELLHAIRTVAAHRTYLPPELVDTLVDGYRTRQLPGRSRQLLLTPRERELVQLIAEGYSTQQIAQRLHISAKTVATHRENVLGKLQISGIAQLTRYAIREGLSSLELSCDPADNVLSNIRGIASARTGSSLAVRELTPVQCKRA